MTWPAAASTHKAYPVCYLMLEAESIKLLDLHTLIANDQLDIQAVTETFLSNDVNDSVLNDCSKYGSF